ncbi:transporter substrate-binding domain-containing protein [Mycoplasmatota bacterium WC44]
MKKIIILCLTFILVFSLSACGQKEDVLRVGMDLQYPPFETVDEMNNPMGISVDIAKELGEFMGVDVEIVNTDFGSIIPALESGDIDIAIASMSINEEREKKVDFTNPYVFFKIIGLLNVDYAEANGIDANTPMSEILKNKDTRFVGLASQVSASIPQSLGFDVLEATEKASAILEVSQGTADVFLMSGSVVAQAHKSQPNTTMIVWSPIQSSPIGMAVAEGNTQLLEKANEFILKMNDEGGVNDMLTEKWDEVIRESLAGLHGFEFYLNEN